MFSARVPTSDEYLALRAASEVKLEFADGQVLAMSGGSPLHAAVGSNLQVALARALRGTPCRQTSSDQGIHVESTDGWFFPDGSVVCGEWRVARDGLAIVNPSLIAEVLSPSTRLYS